jgi:REP element-mobilizing transposase RayT
MPTTYTKLLYHIVFSTKRREPLILPIIKEDLYEELRRIIRDQRGEPIEIGGTADHVHVVAKLRSEPSLAKVMQQLKGASSSFVNQLGKYTAKFYWQEGYGAFTVSPGALGDLRAYVRNQVEHHRVHSFQEEFLKFLHEHEIEYDEQYLWD